MIVDRLLAAREPLLVEQDQRHNSVLRLSLLRAGLGVLAAASLTQITAKTTDLPFVTTPRYVPHEMDYTYDIHLADLSPEAPRTTAELTVSSPDIIDQTVMRLDGKPESDNTMITYGESGHYNSYFLIDPQRFTINLNAFSLKTGDLALEGSGIEPLNFIIGYGETDATANSEIINSADIDRLYPDLKGVSTIADTMEFPFTVEIVDNLINYYRDATGENANMLNIQDLLDNDQTGSVREDIIAILARSYPELAEYGLVTTFFSSGGGETAPPRVELEQSQHNETACVIQAETSETTILYGEETRIPNFYAAAFAGGLLGLFAGYRKKKIPRDPPHVDSPSNQTIDRVRSGVASAQDKVQVAYWKNWIDKTAVPAAELKQARKKSKTARALIILACSPFTALPALFQELTTDEVPREHISKSSSLDPKNTTETCDPKMRIYYKFTKPEKPDRYVVFIDDDDIQQVGK